MLTLPPLPRQENMGMPCPQRVVQLPDIAWDKYTSGLGDFEREFCDKKRKTRQLKLIFDQGECNLRVCVCVCLCVCVCVLDGTRR
jgi:hypothetical protein